MAITPAIYASLGIAAEAIEITEVTSVKQFAAAEAIVKESCVESGTDRESTVKNWSAFIREGQAVFLLARSEGKVIGFAASGLGPHLHYADLSIINNRILFVSKSHRSGNTGLKLLQEAERIAKERGARLALVTVSKNNSQGGIVRGTGYAVQETIFVKEL